jgi:hypothetical protein
LLQGLQTDAINLAQQAPDWAGRLAWMNARLAAARGQRDAALKLLHEAAAGLDKDASSHRYNLEAVAALRARLR